MNKTPLHRRSAAPSFGCRPCVFVVVCLVLALPALPLSGAVSTEEARSEVQRADVAARRLATLGGNDGTWRLESGASMLHEDSLNGVRANQVGNLLDGRALVHNLEGGRLGEIFRVASASSEEGYLYVPNHGRDATFYARTWPGPALRIVEAEIGGATDRETVSQRQLVLYDHELYLRVTFRGENEKPLFVRLHSLKVVDLLAPAKPGGSVAGVSAVQRNLVEPAVSTVEKSAWTESEGNRATRHSFGAQAGARRDTSRWIEVPFEASLKEDGR